jgi:apolipoprotein N-acyltransferase
VSLRDFLPERREVLPAALVAVLLFVAYPPASLVVPSFCALVPFLWVLERTASERRAGPPTWRLGDFLLGYWFGACANGVVLYWIVVALFHFTPLSLAGYLAAIFIVLAPMWGIVSWAYLRVRTRTTIPVWVAFPLIWTAVEFLQAHLGDVRFPWLGIGTSLVRLPVLVQWADTAGARGVTLWLAWANAMVYLALKDRARAWRPLGLVGATVALALGYGLWRERTLVMRPVTTVAVIQPNVGFKEKRESREQDTLAIALLALVRRADSIPGVRLVAWPEAALEGYFLNKPEWPGWIGAVSRGSGIPILGGGLDAELRPEGWYEPFNAAFLFDSAGSYTDQPSYRKKYLVPIVERVPFLNPRWFGDLKWFGGFGKGDRFPVYLIREGGFGVLICYESAFEDLARGYRGRGADFLVNITNDAWFGRTAAPYQHASHLVMRAIETRIGIARAANTGISQFVDPLGYTHDNTPLYVPRVEAAEVLTTDVRTLYVRLGDWVALVAAVGALACLAASYRPTSPQGETA